ncbi:hypothetical protein TRFO_10813 [Tritrichomonas foetus]|uniref:Uncharacterized protein n=1 Tax=Tritrichomonas foetus TaxID=1144522 RepID=A0A1J4J869_9EUKA|nr:hypothetical protein TRFO_10813 [Tritrichomonas foetus]|eukprot:OHS94881.1 hypothetical protein TRFO_10813 [Tritrichomonas foetus]
MGEERRLYRQYDAILKDSQEIESFLGSATKKGIEQQMSEDFESLQRISRQIYVKTFAFDKFFPLPLTEDKIVGSFCSQEKQFFNMIGNPQFQQSIAYGIRQIYEPAQAQQFAEAVHDYFSDPKRKDLFPIFVYVLFPAIYGFFLSEEQSMYAFDFLSSLLELDNDFFKPFFVSYFSSATVFTDVFWHEFFKLVKVEERFKPSIAQLYEYFVKAFQDSCQYLTPYHVQIAITFMLNDAIGFCDAFFRRYLMTTFNAWVSYNPSVSSSKVTAEKLEMLFNFFSENTESQNFQQILDIFQRNVFSISELISFVEHTPIKKVTCLLSPLEAKMISEIFLMIPDIAPSIYPATKINDENGIFQNFNAGSIEVFLRTKKNIDQEKQNLIYKEAKSEIVEKTEANDRSWNIISQICSEIGVDPLKTMMMCDTAEPDDTIFDKMAKKKIKQRVSDSLKKYVMSIYRKNVTSKQEQFEEFLLQQHLSQQLGKMRQRLVHYGEIIEQLIFSRLKNTETLVKNNLFTSSIIRLKMRVDEDKSEFQVRDSQAQFDRMIKDYTLKVPKFQEFLMEREPFFKSLIMTLSRLDELSLGDRFFVLYHVYSQITILTAPMSKDTEFENPEACANALFARIVGESKCRSFLKSFVCICSFQSTNSDQFKILPEEMIDTWNRIKSFIISLVQADSFDQRARTNILKHIK